MREPQRVNALEIFPEPRLAGSPPRVLCSQVGALSSQMVAMTVAPLSCGHGSWKLSQITREM